MPTINAKEKVYAAQQAAASKKSGTVTKTKTTSTPSRAPTAPVPYYNAPVQAPTSQNMGGGGGKKKMAPKAKPVPKQETPNLALQTGWQQAAQPGFQYGMPMPTNYAPGVPRFVGTGPASIFNSPNWQANDARLIAAANQLRSASVFNSPNWRANDRLLIAAANQRRAAKAVAPTFAGAQGLRSPNDEIIALGGTQVGTSGTTPLQRSMQTLMEEWAARNPEGNLIAIPDYTGGDDGSGGGRGYGGGWGGGGGGGGGGSGGYTGPYPPLMTWRF